MKKIVFIQILMAVIAITSCNNSQQKTDDATTNDTIGISANDTTSAFEVFSQYFSKSAAFAYTEMSGHKVLLVSHEVFGNNINDDLEALATSIFALDNEGKVVALGSIRSQGTLYPVSVLDGKLMVAGHHFVKVYSIRGDIPELVLDSYEEDESPKLAEMFKTFETGTPIKFEKRNTE